jgi:peptide/nickel transport system substrate-binding protein
MQNDRAEDNYWAGRRKRSLSRRAFVSAAVVGAAGITGACGGRNGAKTAPPPASQASSTPQSGGILNPDALYGTPPSLDAHETSSTWAMQSNSRVMSRLLRFQTATDPKVGADRNTESELALSLETPDAITWTVKLRPDARFHNVPPVNGHAVEAEDVKATFTRALGDPKNPYRGILSYIDLEQLQTPAKDTVVFKLKYPYSPFRKALASTNYGWIFPREVLAGSYEPSKVMIGSGPFTFDSFTPDVALTVKKNQDWFEKGRPYVDGVNLAIIPDASQRVAQFQGGHLDVVTVLPNDLATVRRSSPKATEITALPSSGNMIYFQLGDPSSPWQDIRLRRALSMAIDRDALGKSVFVDDYALAFNVGAAFGKWALTMDALPSATAQYYKFNPSEAKKLLDAAGASNLSIKVGYPAPYPVQSFTQALEAINSMLNGVGIKTALVAIDYNKDWLAGGKGARYGNFPSDMITFGGIEGANDVDDYMFNYFGSTSTSNEEHLKDPDLDAMIAKARTVIDDDARVKAYLDIQKYIADKMYTVAGLPQPRIHVFYAPRVQNLQLSQGSAVSAANGSETDAKVWLAKQ